MGAYLTIYTTEEKKKKSTNNRAQMGNSLQIKLHVENSFSPTYYSLKLLKK